MLSRWTLDSRELMVRSRMKRAWRPGEKRQDFVHLAGRYFLSVPDLLKFPANCT